MYVSFQLATVGSGHDLPNHCWIYVNLTTMNFSNQILNIYSKTTNDDSVAKKMEVIQCKPYAAN